MDVAVLGAGDVGRDLAQVFAAAGYAVRLQAADATAVMDAIDVIEPRVGDETVDRIDATTGLEGAVADADLVLETSAGPPESLHERLAAIEEDIGPETIIALASLEDGVTMAAAGLRHPDRAIGLALADPLKATVVELTVADQTGPATLDRMENLAADLGLTPAVVRDHPGIVSTRLALAAEAEAMRAVADGVASVAAVDAAFAKRYGHPVGPLERADRAGLDRRLETLEYLADTLGPRFDPPTVLRNLVADGHTGHQSGTGFYEWENDEPAAGALPTPDFTERPTGPDDPAH